MKTTGLQKIIFVYALVYNINRSLISVFAAGGDVPTRDVTTMTPVDLDISDRADSVYFTYSKSADSIIHTFKAKDGFAIRNIKVTDKSTGRSEHLWGSSAAITNAYKVIGYTSGDNANFIEIHLLNNGVTSVYSSVFSSSHEAKSVKKSIVEEEITSPGSEKPAPEKHVPEKPVPEKPESADTSTTTTTTTTVNYKLLYILLPTILAAIAIVAAGVVLLVYRRKRENSANLLTHETPV
ncbi:hypothetical protein TOT_010001166 [Theileria orientalis strain Shintoku]|uniref:Uncharacterized protein n=1 Tax=Theileria orientalis strain Shintoku TaxID=869250 RepID=J4CCN7_THEOR|nr:hypothetical protein TOT_010001166 [Theileria orientalis strain Shintoku]BAM39712.1 hypothetical protein TOT_010001166 [Theileria orientalis strain Shintoku]|eukprot:XP_009690013.1 hypothetical protein TOT_010001166 [Theileria orientalis strain Shintoku]